MIKHNRNTREKMKTVSIILIFLLWRSRLLWSSVGDKNSHTFNRLK